jgi:hypothetical protein
MWVRRVADVVTFHLQDFENIINENVPIKTFIVRPTFVLQPWCFS